MFKNLETGKGVTQKCIYSNGLGKCKYLNIAVVTQDGNIFINIIIGPMMRCVDGNTANLERYVHFNLKKARASESFIKFKGSTFCFNLIVFFYR